MGLQIHPKLRTIAEVQAQPKRGIGRDAPPIVDDLGDPVWRDLDRLRELTLRQTIRPQEFFFQHFARGDCGHRQILQSAALTASSLCLATRRY